MLDFNSLKMSQENIQQETLQQQQGQEQTQQQQEVKPEQQQQPQEQQGFEYKYPKKSELLSKATELERECQASLYTDDVERNQDYIDAMEKGNGKSVVWEILKQIRPGMDLAYVTMPTHIMEPRSICERLTDYFAHIQFMSDAANETTPEKIGRASCRERV